MRRPRDMIRAKHYNRCGCGAHSMGNKPKDSNHWRLKNGIRMQRKSHPRCQAS